MNGLVNESWWTRPGGGKDVLRIALPMVATTLSWTVMQFIDSAFLMNKISATAMAAAYSAGVIWFAAMSFMFGLCSYAGTFVAQFLGDGQPRKIGPVVWQGVWLGLGFSIVLPAVRAAAPAMFGLFKHDPGMASMEIEFFQVLCYGAPGLLAAQALEAFFGGRGKTWVVMLVDACAVLVNLCLACVLVLGWGGVESWGVKGAAWSTVITQWWRLGIYLFLATRRRHREEFNTGCVRLDWSLIRRLLRFGGPSGMQMLLDVGGFAIFMLLVGTLGLVEAEATSLTFRISQLAFMPVWGFGVATAILVGQKLGQDRPDLAERSARTALELCLTYMGTISLLFVLAPQLFLEGFFTGEAVASATSQDVRHLTVQLMRFVAAYNMFDATVIIFVSVLRGAGDTRFVMFLSVCMALLLAGGTAVGVLALGMQVYGAWAFITGWVWALGVAYLWRYRRGPWRGMRVIERYMGTA
jgi:MATE family multidrug resistance protein